MTNRSQTACTVVSSSARGRASTLVSATQYALVGFMTTCCLIGCTRDREREAPEPPSVASATPTPPAPPAPSACAKLRELSGVLPPLAEGVRITARWFVGNELARALDRDAASIPVGRRAHLVAITNLPDTLEMVMMLESPRLSAAPLEASVENGCVTMGLVASDLPSDEYRVSLETMPLFGQTLDALAIVGENGENMKGPLVHVEGETPVARWEGTLVVGASREAARDAGRQLSVQTREEVRRLVAAGREMSALRRAMAADRPAATSACFDRSAELRPRVEALPRLTELVVVGVTLRECIRCTPEADAKCETAQSVVDHVFAQPVP